MRRERISIKRAQNIWDSIKKSLRLAPYQGEGAELPHIDMAEIFAGRKSMKTDELCSEITKKLAS